MGLCLVIGIIIGLLAKPIYKMALSDLMQPKYSQLMFECDFAMRTHLTAKLNFAEASDSLKLERLQAAEVGLLNCQDYDLFQKKLLQFGLDEHDLSYMRLVAVEEKGNDLLEVVKEHEFRY